MDVLLIGNLLVEGKQAAEEVLTLMVVRNNLRCLKVVVTVELELLTYNTGALQNDVSNGLALEGKSLNLIKLLSACSNCSVKD